MHKVLQMYENKLVYAKFLEAMQIFVWQYNILVLFSFTLTLLSLLVENDFVFICLFQSFNLNV